MHQQQIQNEPLDAEASSHHAAHAWFLTSENISTKTTALPPKSYTVLAGLQNEAAAYKIYEHNAVQIYLSIKQKLLIQQFNLTMIIYVKR